MRIVVNKYWRVYLDFGRAGCLSLQLYWTYHILLHMRVAVTNHALPFYKKNRIASLLCIFETTIASLIRQSGYLQITEIPRFDVLNRYTCCCRNTQFWMQWTNNLSSANTFQRPGGKNDKLPLGRPRITTHFEVRVIVTSTWRYRFMAAWKLLKFLSHATDTRIPVCTTRNHLRGARLFLELWNLNFSIDHFVYFWWRKWVYFRNFLLKMFTFVRHYMNFIFSKVFVNIKTVFQNYCTQCLYWLNFFFLVYVKFQ